jgi:hypothetical protein
MSSIGAAPGAAVTVSNARAEASRRNGARSRGPTTQEGKARSSQNALKHGLRAAKHLVLPAEDPAALAALEAALLEELAPEGALQTVLARQIVSAAWRLARVDRMEAEMLIFRDRGEGDLGLAATRDANTARALPTLVRYRAAAHAEFLRSLRTLEALQAEAAKTGAVSVARPGKPAGRAPVAARPDEPGAALAARPANAAARPPAAAQPNGPESGAVPRRQDVLPEQAPPAFARHEAAAPWLPRPDAAPRPNEPETRQKAASALVRPDFAPIGPEPHRARRDPGELAAPGGMPSRGGPGGGDSMGGGSQRRSAVSTT